MATVLDMWVNQLLKPETLGIFIAGLAALIAACSALAAAQASRIAGKALLAQHVPWISISNAIITDEVEDGDTFTFDIQALLKNYGTAPALGLFVDFSVTGYDLPPESCGAHGVSLMPQEELTSNRRIQLPIREGEKLNAALLTGDKHLNLTFRFTDTLEQAYSVSHEIKFSAHDHFSCIRYHIDGLPK